jgi:hypothetical protein
LDPLFPDLLVLTFNLFLQVNLLITVVEYVLEVCFKKRQEVFVIKDFDLIVIISQYSQCGIHGNVHFLDTGTTFGIINSSETSSVE